MSGGFFGAGVFSPTEVVLGNLLGKGGLFGPIIAQPVAPVGYIIQAGAGGMPGFSYNMVGWAGTVGGPDVVGSVVSGAPQAAFGPGSTLAYGDVLSGAGPLPIIPPFFAVSVPGIGNLHQFNTVTINGTTFSTFDLNVQFTQSGGDGPTIWGWNGEEANLVAGTQYPVVFT